VKNAGKTWEHFKKEKRNRVVISFVSSDSIFFRARINEIIE
jgi:hypothetical protein